VVARYFGEDRWMSFAKTSEKHQGWRGCFDPSSALAALDTRSCTGYPEAGEGI
jgi:hypothetical protein